MAGVGGMRAALHGTLPPRTPPAEGASVTTRGDGGVRTSPRRHGIHRAALRVRAGMLSCAIQDVQPSPTRWEAVRRSQG
jgi:hypothetical protein